MPEQFNAKASLRFAGDVNIDSAIIVTPSGVAQNITLQVISVIVYEDLFSPFMTGSLIIKDALDLNNVFPLLGEETLKLKISTPTIQGAIIQGDFLVYKMSDKIDHGDRSVMYELNFVSIEILAEQNKKVSKVFSGKISDIVPKFMFDPMDGLESKKQFNVENTRNTIKYVSPYWSPVKNLKFLSDSSISETQSPSFLFFENRDGFNFRSLDKLYENKPVQDFVQDKYTRDKFPGGGNVLNIDQDYKRIGVLMYVDNYDYVDRIGNGMLSSKLISYDSTKKSYTVKNYDLKSKFYSQKHLNDHPPFTDSLLNRSDATHILFPKAFETFTSFGDTTNSRILQERISYLKLAENQKIQIKVPGRLDYTVGQTCNVTVYKKEPIRKSDTVGSVIDRIVSGKYLISAIKHNITVQGHDCYLELIKDSLKRAV